MRKSKVKNFAFLKLVAVERAKRYLEDFRPVFLLISTTRRLFFLSKNSSFTCSFILTSSVGNFLTRFYFIFKYQLPYIHYALLNETATFSYSLLIFWCIILQVQFLLYLCLIKAKEKSRAAGKTYNFSYFFKMFYLKGAF